MHGGWTLWSSWSTCSPDCLHHRRRSCDNPSPSNGGGYCFGNDLDSTNCTGGMCRGNLFELMEIYSFIYFGGGLSGTD